MVAAMARLRPIGAMSALLGLVRVARGVDPEMPTVADCPECVFEKWTCPQACTAAHHDQYFGFTHVIGSCSDEFPADGNSMVIETTFNCMFRREAMPCENMTLRNFSGLSVLNGCTRASGSISVPVANESCGWRCRMGLPTSRCMWDFNLDNDVAVPGSIKECWIRPLCFGNVRIEIFVVCKPSAFWSDYKNMTRNSTANSSYMQEAREQALRLDALLIAYQRLVEDTQEQLNLAATIQIMPTVRLRSHGATLLALQSDLVLSIAQVEASAAHATVARPSWDRALLANAEMRVLLPKVAASVRVADGELSARLLAERQAVVPFNHERWPPVDYAGFVGMAVGLGVQSLIIFVLVVALVVLVRRRKMCPPSGNVAGVGTMAGGSSQYPVVVGRPVISVSRPATVSEGESLPGAKGAVAPPPRPAAASI